MSVGPVLIRAANKSSFLLLKLGLLEIGLAQAQYEP